MNNKHGKIGLKQFGIFDPNSAAAFIKRSNERTFILMFVRYFIMYLIPL